MAYTGRMKGLFGFVSALVVFSVLAGCQSGPAIVGKWNATGGVVQGQQGSGTLEFKGDKTYVMLITGQGTTFRMDGTYTFEEKNLTLTVSEAKIEGDLPPQAAAMKPMLDKMMADIKGQTTKGTVEFKSNDEAVFTAEGGTPTTLTRVKG